MVTLRTAYAAVGGDQLLDDRAQVVHGIWWRLKICSWDECEGAYYDHSKNRSRAWCEYGCGNKAKTRAYRARQRAQAT